VQEDVFVCFKNIVAELTVGFLLAAWCCCTVEQVGFRSTLVLHGGLWAIMLHTLTQEHGTCMLTSLVPTVKDAFKS
jgi:hypothetical protein